MAILDIIENAIGDEYFRIPTDMEKNLIELVKEQKNNEIYREQPDSNTIVFLR